MVASAPAATDSSTPRVDRPAQPLGAQPVATGGPRDHGQKGLVMANVGEVMVTIERRASWLMMVN